MLEFNVRGQKLTRIDSFEPAEKSVGYLKAKVNFLTDEWKSADTVKLRAKNQKDIVVHEDDVVDGIALVPWEALESDGTFSVSLFARSGEVEITTGTVAIGLLDTLERGMQTNPPTPTEFDKLRQDVDELKEQVENMEPGGGGGVSDEQLTAAVVAALEEAKESGEFDGPAGPQGPAGDDYVLTDADKAEIAEMAAGLVEVPDSGGNVDLTGYATEQWVKDQNYLTEVPSGYATEEFVKNKIAEAEMAGEEVDLSGYAQKSELPTKVSQLQNDSGYLTEHQDISGKLDVSELPTAINTALAQAKASGEFDGKDGADGQPGKDGADGAPGEKGDKGDKGDTGETGPKGDTGATGATGAAGYTPVKGTDYWTPADQEAIVQQVIAALGTPVFGTVDAEKNIVLSGSLAEGSYTVKYEDAEGNQTVIGSITVGSVIINMIPISTDIDGSVYNDIGYKGSTRLNSSGTAASMDGYSVTGFIPITFNDVMYGASGMFNEEYYDEIAVYTADKTFISKIQTRTSNRPATVAVNDDGTWSFTPSLDASFSNIAYVRVCAVNIDENSIITINQPLP